MKERETRLRRKVWRKSLGFALFLLAFCAAAGGLTLLAGGWMGGEERPSGEPAPLPVHTVTVVLDAGHGGEDGGTVGADGTTEKTVNLAVTLLLRDHLAANGVNVVLTRESDTMLYDRNADFKGKKKALDLAERRRIAEETENAVFVSIHMNSYPQKQYSGLQVWYSPNHPASREIAQTIQSTAREVLQPENTRGVKAAGSSIYLLHRLQCPAVLVECGFLSNPEEAALLNTEEYRGKLAKTLSDAILTAIEKMENEEATAKTP